MYKAKSTTLLAVSARSPDLLLLPFLASFGCACVVPPSSACAFGGSSSSSTGALCPDGPNPQFSTIKGFISIDCQCCAFRNCGFQARICWISINGFRASSWRRNKQAERRRRARSLKRVLRGPTLAHLASFPGTIPIPNRSIQVSKDLMGQSLAWLLVAVPDFQPLKAICAESGAAHIASTRFLRTRSERSARECEPLLLSFLCLQLERARRLAPAPRVVGLFLSKGPFDRLPALLLRAGLRRGAEHKLPPPCPADRGGVEGDAQ